MRITLLLRHGKVRRYKQVRGAQHRGKTQVPHRISASEREKFVEALHVECTNEMWLTRPYLSRAEEKFLPSQLVKTEVDSYEMVNNEDLEHKRSLAYRIKMKPHVHFDKRWSCLEKDSKWTENEYFKNKRVYQKLAECCIPNKYPDFWPPAKDNWEEWNKIEGFGLKDKKT